MREFNRESKGRFGRRDSGRSSRFGRRESGGQGRNNFDRRGRSYEHEMFEATCGKCGRQCEVPFKPTGSRPVYCSDCFRNPESLESRNPAPESSDELREINKKLDKIMRALKID